MSKQNESTAFAVDFLTPENAGAASGPFEGLTAYIRGSVHDINPLSIDSAKTTIQSDAGIFQSREASREVASLATDEEYEALLGEHAELTEKHFGTGLSRSERLKLQMVRWSIDRIEDARYGRTLDVLESLALTQEFMAMRLDRTSENVERSTSEASRKRSGGR
ncbi:MAG TPA: hypothetical protein VGK77_09020 [Candidatus Binatia bacterium]|jgi:hypothetical protein